jgi:hypothetical protein
MVWVCYLFRQEDNMSTYQAPTKALIIVVDVNPSLTPTPTISLSLSCPSLNRFISLAACGAVIVPDQSLEAASTTLMSLLMTKSPIGSGRVMAVATDTKLSSSPPPPPTPTTTAPSPSPAGAFPDATAAMGLTIWTTCCASYDAIITSRQHNGHLLSPRYLTLSSSSSPSSTTTIPTNDASSLESKNDRLTVTSTELCDQLLTQLSEPAASTGGAKKGGSNIRRSNIIILHLSLTRSNWVSYVESLFSQLTTHILPGNVGETPRAPHIYTTLLVNDHNGTQPILTPLTSVPSSPFDAIIPPQSYASSTPSKCVRMASYHYQSTRKDDVDSLSLLLGTSTSSATATATATPLTLLGVSSLSCLHGVISHHFLAEIGFKLGLIPKYGA